MKELLETIAMALVEDPSQVMVTTEEKEDLLVLNLQVAENDMGKVIGKSGRVAKAIRQLVSAAALKENKKVVIDIG